MYQKGRHQILQHLPLPCWAGTSQGQGQSALSWNGRVRQIYWRWGKSKENPFLGKDRAFDFLVHHSRQSCWDCFFGSHQPDLWEISQACEDCEWGKEAGVRSWYQRERQSKPGQILVITIHCVHHPLFTLQSRLPSTTSIHAYNNLSK